MGTRETIQTKIDRSNLWLDVAEGRSATSFLRRTMMAHQIVFVRLQQWIAGVALVFAVAFVLALSAPPAWGQATAALNGTVRDAAGAVIVDATVVLHNRDTNLDRTAQSNNVGSYVMTNVLPGNYDLKVSMNGFGTASKT